MPMPQGPPIPEYMTPCCLCFSGLEKTTASAPNAAAFLRIFFCSVPKSSYSLSSTLNWAIATWAQGGFRSSTSTSCVEDFGRIRVIRQFHDIDGGTSRDAYPYHGDSQKWHDSLVEPIHSEPLPIADTVQSFDLPSVAASFQWYGVYPDRLRGYFHTHVHDRSI